jgi:uncharacterized protein (DUF1800 family)
MNRIALISALAALSAPLASCGEDQPAAQSAVSSQSLVATTPIRKPLNDQDAQRFLQQAAFAYTPEDVARVRKIGYIAWIDEQMALPIQFSNLDRMNRINPGQGNARTWYINDGAWIGLTTTKDQLRQRTMFALSQIFVASARDSSTLYYGRSFAKFIDDLQTDSFGNFRTLIENVTRSAAMGQYLSHNFNDKENPTTGAVPDQNYAREIMQLFSIGLWQLNPDGTRKLDSAGKPIPTYTQNDVVGASRIFSGFAPSWANEGNWSNHSCNCPDGAPASEQQKGLIGFNNHHSTLVKSFLGQTIPAGSSNAEGDLKIFLDTLFAHPNVGPFIARQMIQRLVTSNPSPAYVGRVAAAFASNGAGVRGDMKAVVKAILIDPEARDASAAQSPEFGRIREPVVRAIQIFRAFKGRPEADPDYLGIPEWIFDRRKGLWQSPFGSPTVFNFYGPDYTPANTDLSRRGLVAPEMQITTGVSVGDIDSFLFGIIENGGRSDCCSPALLNTYYLRLDYSDWLPLVATPPALVDKMNYTFMAGQMTPALKAKLITVINNSTQSKSRTSGVERGVPQIKFAHAMRAMIMSPDYVVQK